MGTEEHVGPSTGINAEERGPCRSAGNPGRLTGSGSSREKMDRPDRWGGGGGVREIKASMNLCGMNTGASLLWEQGHWMHCPQPDAEVPGLLCCSNTSKHMHWY